VQRWRLPVDQKLHHLAHVPQRDPVIIVQNQHQRPAQRRDVVDQRSHQMQQRRHLRRMHDLLGAAPDVCVHLLEGGDQIAQELHGVVVGVVQRQPDDRRIDLVRPRARQRRLAETRRGGDQGQACVFIQRAVEPRHQRPPADLARAQRRHRQFGRQQQHAHRR